MSALPKSDGVPGNSLVSQPQSQVLAICTHLALFNNLDVAAQEHRRRILRPEGGQSAYGLVDIPWQGTKGYFKVDIQLWLEFFCLKRLLRHGDQLPA